MKILIPIISLVFSFTALAQSEADLILLRQKLEAEAKQLEIDEEKYLKDQQVLKEKKEQKEKELEYLKVLKVERPKVERELRKEISDALGSMSLGERMVSRKANYYRCLRDSLDSFQVVDTTRCRRLHAADLSKEEEAQNTEWKQRLPYGPSETNSRITEYEREVKRLEGQVEASHRFDNYYAQQRQRLKDNNKLLDSKFEDITLIKEHQNIANCDKNSPMVDLEQEVPYPNAKVKGPFYNVRRDNQDGQGTCYANTAKNLIVGVSGGADIPSFLDLALHYKTDSALITDALDAGTSCGVIQKIESVGFCPQENAPMETGERNHLVEGLFAPNGTSVSSQSTTLGVLQKFMQGQDRFNRNNREYAEKILPQAQFIIQSLNSNPLIKVPLPVVRKGMIEDWKLRETYFVYKDRYPGKSETQFLNEHNAIYRKFFPTYVRAIINGKSADEIFSMYEEVAKPFFIMNRIPEKIPEFRKNFIRNISNDLQDKDLKRSIAETLRFMKLITKKEQTSDDEFLDFCSTNFEDGMHFLADLQPLLDHLNSIKVSPTLLYDEKGNFKSGRELMQLAIAPGCLNPQNRKPLTEGIICEDGYAQIRFIKDNKRSYNEQIKLFRERVTASLVRGLPLGNTFPASPPLRHINTIVGMQFNPKTQTCQYRIRESQTGTSYWAEEASLFGKIEALTEVRKK